MWLQLGTVFFAAILWLGLRIYKKVLEYNRVARVLKGQFPSVPRNSLLLGNASPDAFGSPQMHRWLLETSLKYGKTFLMRIAIRPVVVTCCPELLAAVHDRHLYPEYLDKPAYQKGFNIIHPDPNVNSIMSAVSSDPLWKSVRKGVAPAFNPANLRAEFPATVDSAMHLVETFHKAGPDVAIDVDKAAQRQAMDVIGRVGFAKNYHATDTIEGNAGEMSIDPFELLADSLVEVTRRLRNPWRDLFFFTKDYQDNMKKVKLLRKEMSNMANEVKSRGLEGVPAHTIAGHLMRLEDPAHPKKPLPDNIFSANATIFFGAGVDTSGHTVAWLLYHISQHPEVEKKLVAELDAAGLLVSPSRPSPRRMVYQDMSHLPYLGWVIKESMRIFPTVGGIFPREVKKDVHLCNFFFPKGTIIFTPVFATHNHPENWERPDEFIPERWAVEGAEYYPVGGIKQDAGSREQAPGCPPAEATSKENGSQAHQRPIRYVPFGAGPRQCIGLSLARQNIATTVALLLSNFTFKLAEQMGGPEGVQALEFERITVSPKHGMWLHAIPRPTA
eukprot:jgi/Botrbrau1/1772/Bobra.0217s0027.1